MRTSVHVRVCVCLCLCQCQCRCVCVFVRRCLPGHVYMQMRGCLLRAWVRACVRVCVRACLLVSANERRRFAVRTDSGSGSARARAVWAAARPRLHLNRTVPLVLFVITAGMHRSAADEPHVPFAGTRRAGLHVRARADQRGARPGAPPAHGSASVWWRQVSLAVVVVPGGPHRGARWAWQWWCLVGRAVLVPD